MDQEAFSEQVFLRRDTLYRIARALLRREEDCQDAVSEAVLRAWANRRSLRDESKFGPWITRILVNECRTLARRQRRIVITDAPPDTPAPPHESAVLDALCALPESLRLPIVLHYVEGYTLEEVAAILRVPRSTVRGRLARGRAALRLELSEEGKKP